MLTSTDDEYRGDDAEGADDDAVELHATADSLTYVARTNEAPTRHRSAPNASADDEKPLPSTVKGVPPSDAPRSGHTDETDTPGRYVKANALHTNCSPFADSASRRAPDDDDEGDAHSSWRPPMRRAAAVALLPSKRQRSLKPSTNTPPNTDTRLPPDTGPAGGTSELACNAPCTYRLPPLRSRVPCIDTSTLDHPVASPDGETQRTPSEPCAEPNDTDDADDARANEPPTPNTH